MFERIMDLNGPADYGFEKVVGGVSSRTFDDCIRNLIQLNIGICLNEYEV